MTKRKKDRSKIYNEIMSLSLIQRCILFSDKRNWFIEPWENGNGVDIFHSPLASKHEIKEFAKEKGYYRKCHKCSQYCIMPDGIDILCDDCMEESD